MLYMFLNFYAFLDHEIEIHLYFSSQKKAWKFESVQQKRQEFQTQIIKL